MVNRIADEGYTSTLGDTLLFMDWSSALWLPHNPHCCKMRSVSCIGAFGSIVTYDTGWNEAKADNNE